MRWSFADSHNHLEPGGWGRQTTMRELPTAPEIAGVNMRLTAGGVRELHWPKSAEWAFVFKGDVFTQDFLEMWVSNKRKEHDALRLRPHPYEFFLYYDV
jgi:hypothetical protein